MEIGQVIRKYRKEKNMTQEEMARRLGVTAPAVNKWESGASAPDIALLAPIARMLGITTDTLLCFREALTEELFSRALVGRLERGFPFLLPWYDYFDSLDADPDPIPRRSADRPEIS